MIATINGNKIIIVPCKKTKVVDITGTGDILNATFSVKMFKGDSIEDVLRYANIVASQLIEKLGTQSGTPNQKEALKVREEAK